MYQFHVTKVLKLNKRRQMSGELFLKLLLWWVNHVVPVYRKCSRTEFLVCVMDAQKSFVMLSSLSLCSPTGGWVNSAHSIDRFPSEYPLTNAPNNAYYLFRSALSVEAGQLFRTFSCVWARAAMTKRAVAVSIMKAFNTGADVYKWTVFGHSVCFRNYIVVAMTNKTLWETKLFSLDKNANSQCTVG